MDKFYHNKRYHSCSYVTKVEPCWSHQNLPRQKSWICLGLRRLKEPKKNPSSQLIDSPVVFGSTRRIRRIFRSGPRPSYGPLLTGAFYVGLLDELLGVAGMLLLVIMGWVAGGCWDVYYYSDYGSFPHSLLSTSKINSNPQSPVPASGSVPDGPIASCIAAPGGSKALKGRMPRCPHVW